MEWSSCLAGRRVVDEGLSIMMFVPHVVFCRLGLTALGAAFIVVDGSDLLDTLHLNNIKLLQPNDPIKALLVVELRWLTYNLGLEQCDA